MLFDIERILISCIWYKDLPLVYVFEDNVLPVNCDRGIVFCGFRHPHAMYSMCSITGKRSVTPEVGEYVQGFLTNKNRFVDREEGYKIAYTAGQVEGEYREGRHLFSEDLY
jgi:hypothetical protein